MISPQAQSVKSWLEAYVREEEAIDAKLDKLRRIEARMLGVRAMEISDMPRAHSGETDRMASMLIEKEKVEEDILSAIKKHDESRQAIETIVELLPHALWQNVIELHYIDGMGWTEINGLCHGRMGDFDQKADTYLRRIYRAHDYALESMAKNWNTAR